MVWSVDRERWGPVRNLRPGARVRLLGGGDAVVEALTELSETVPVYNLEVDADHVYRVTAAGVLVHNQSACVLFRADDLPYSRLGPRGLKSYIDETGTLVPASVSGLYKGRRVTVAEHVLGGRNRLAKQFSPFTSFSALESIGEMFGRTFTIRLDAEGLAHAIRRGDDAVRNTRIITPRDIQYLIASNQAISASRRSLAAGFSHKWVEYLVEGPIPPQFLTVLQSQT